MESDSTDLVKEIKKKAILHWNCRGLEEFPEAIRIYGGHIQEIYLKWNKLTTLPPWITELLNLTNLYMYGNLIKEIPLELCQMSHLTVLDLSANKLEQISPSIGNLISLKSLLLNNNSINKLPVEMNQMHNLEILSISGNKFVALPEWIGSLPKLKEIIADNNSLKELPNRLTLSPRLSIISVCSNRLRYLPLNGFVSCPYIKFDANIYLNYLSYPLVHQLTFQIKNSNIQSERSSLGYRCLTNRYDNNIKLKIKMDASHDDDNDIMIDLPRQLLKVHNVHENKVISLWELALRKVYTARYKHTLNICVSPVSINVRYEPIAIKNDQEPNFNVSRNLLMNGPISICVNFQCQQPIFTETWIIVGVSHCIESITTVALCCCKRCAVEFSEHSNITIKHIWHCVN